MSYLRKGRREDAKKRLKEQEAHMKLFRQNVLIMNHIFHSLVDKGLEEPELDQAIDELAQGKLEDELKQMVKDGLLEEYRKLHTS